MLLKISLNKISFLFTVLFLFVQNINSQEDPQKKNDEFKQEFLNLINHNQYKKYVSFDFNLNNQSKKSTFLAVCLSILLPGMGELYSDRFDVGQYSLVADAGLWLSFTGVNIYSYKIRDDGRSFARIHAGFDDNNKNDDYYTNVSNFMNVYEYNEKKLRDRNYSKIYDPNSNMSWQWDSDENRSRFRDMRVKSDEILNNIKYISIALIANRIISAINAARFTNQYNDRLNQASSMNVSFGVTQYNNKYNGFIINLNKSF